MPATLILTMVGLLFLLIILVFIYVWFARTQKSAPITTETIETFESLSAIIKNRSSSVQSLHHAVEVILARFGSITPQSVRAYRDLIEALCVHSHTDSKLILHFEKTLRTRNPQFEHDIEHALAVGLATRG
jgi:hypothetical protein